MLLALNVFTDYSVEWAIQPENHLFYGMWGVCIHSLMVEIQEEQLTNSEASNIWILKYKRFYQDAKEF